MQTVGFRTQPRRGTCRAQRTVHEHFVCGGLMVDFHDDRFGCRHPLPFKGVTGRGAEGQVMECIGLERTTNGPVVVHCGNGEQVLIGGRQARCH